MELLTRIMTRNSHQIFFRQYYNVNMAKIDPHCAAYNLIQPVSRDPPVRPMPAFARLNRKLEDLRENRWQIISLSRRAGQTVEITSKFNQTDCKSHETAESVLRKFIYAS